MSATLFRNFNSYLRERFGCRVHKISIDAGLTCPNRDGTLSYGGCIYCNPRGSGTGAAWQALTIAEQIRRAKSYLAKRYKAKKFLAYFQSFSNTYAALPVLKEMYEEALADEDVVGLNIGTRPDCVPEEVLEYLAELAREKLIWLEYGLQSAHNSTLELINRGHTVETFQNAVERTRIRGLPICVHVILGLPGESREEMLDTARFLNTQDIQAVKIHLLYIIRGTKLEKLYHAGKYRCLTRQEYVSLTADFLALLRPDIIIQRLTGDPHREELVAPRWALEKQRNLKEIHDYMSVHRIYQGKDYAGA